MTKKHRKDAQVMLIAGAVGLLVLAGAGWGIWELASLVSADWARLWAIAATIAIPVAFALGNRWGQVENRGKLAGIDAGIDRVTRAAATAIDLRAASARKMRQAQAEPPVLLPPLPAPTIVERPQLESGEIVEW